MKAITSPERYQKRSVSATTFTPEIRPPRKVDPSDIQSTRLNSPKNFRFFGKHKHATSRGIIHSMPTHDDPALSPGLKASVHTKTITETQGWLIDHNGLQQVSSDVTSSESLKYRNLDQLLREDKLFTIPEARSAQKKPKAETYSSLPIELRNLPAFRQIFGKQTDSPDKTSLTSPITSGIRRRKAAESSPERKAKNHTTTGFFRKNETQTQYYGLEQVGYSNYKYRKVSDMQFTKAKKGNPALTVHRETIENCIQNIHNQKVLLENMKNQDDIYGYSPSDKLFEEPFMHHKATSSDLDKETHFNYQTPVKRKLEPIKPSVPTHPSYDFNESPDGDFQKAEESLSSSKKQSKSSVNVHQGMSSTGFKFISKKGFVPDLKRIIVNKKQSFNMKQLKMEFEHYSEMSLKYLEECRTRHLDDLLNQNEYYLYQLNHAIREKGICVHVLLETQDYLKAQKKPIVNRLLLALGVNLTSEFPSVGLSQFQTLKRILIHKDLPNAEMVDFIVKFFKLEEQNLHKDAFLRILRSLIDKVDKGSRPMADSNDLYDTFVENYKLTGIMNDDDSHVDFNRFKQVYLFNKMNILDLVDLIAGVN